MDIKTEIQLEFTPENIRKIVQWGAMGSNSPYSHKSIAGWCERFWNKYSDIDAPPDIELYMPLLAEIESEWDMYEAWYSEQHPHAVQAAPLLPEHYFKKWLEQLNA